MCFNTRWARTCNYTVVICLIGWIRQNYWTPENAWSKTLGLYSNSLCYIRFSLNFNTLFSIQAVVERVRSFISLVGKARIIEPRVLNSWTKTLGLYSNPRRYIHFSLNFNTLSIVQTVVERVRSFVWLVGKGRMIYDQVVCSPAPPDRAEFLPWRRLDYQPGFLWYEKCGFLASFSIQGRRSRPKGGRGPPTPDFGRLHNCI